MADPTTTLPAEVETLAKRLEQYAFDWNEPATSGAPVREAASLLRSQAEQIAKLERERDYLAQANQQQAENIQLWVDRALAAERLSATQAEQIAKLEERNEALCNQIYDSIPKWQARDIEARALAAERQLAEALAALEDVVRANVHDFNTPHPDEARRRARDTLSRIRSETKEGSHG